MKHISSSPLMATQFASFFFFFSIALIMFFVCANATYKDIGAAAQFSYNGPNGPQKWGTLSPIYSACSNGRSQSPVNIVKSKCVSGQTLKPLDIEYDLATNATLVNNLFNVGMKYEGKAGVLRLNGKNYNLLQMHWHSPSEHRLDGVQYDAELHIVHKAIDGEIAVIAVLYHYGHPDPLLSKIQNKLMVLAKEVHSSVREQAQVALGTINTKQIRKHTRKYYRYMGSFTTPPCSERVVWNILGKVRSISQEQVEALKAPLIWGCKNNSRPVQPLNERKVEMYDDELN